MVYNEVKIAPYAASSAPKCRKLTRMHAYTLIKSYGAAEGPRWWLVQYLITIHCRRGGRWWKATSGVTAARHCGHTCRQRPKPTLNNDHMDYGEGVDAGVGRSAASMMPINGRRLSSEDFMGLDLSSKDFWTLALRRDISTSIVTSRYLGPCWTQQPILLEWDPPTLYSIHAYIDYL